MIFCVFLSTNPVRKMMFSVTVDEHVSLVLRNSTNLAKEHFLMDQEEPQPEHGANAISANATGGIVNATASASAGNATNGSAASEAPLAPGRRRPKVHAWIASSTEEPAHSLDCSREESDARRARVSCPAVFASREGSAIFLSAVVNLRQGRIFSIQWDNHCKTCGPSSCLTSSRRLETGTLRGGPEQSTQGVCVKPLCLQGDNSCDLMVFITWAGSDAQGNHARSAGMRLSQFTGATLGSVADYVQTGMKAKWDSLPSMPDLPSLPESFR